YEPPCGSLPGRAGLVHKQRQAGKLGLGQIEAEDVAQNLAVSWPVADLAGLDFRAARHGQRTLNEAGEAVGERASDDVQCGEPGARSGRGPVVGLFDIGRSDLSEVERVWRLPLSRRRGAFEQPFPAELAGAAGPTQAVARAIRRFGPSSVGERKRRDVAAAEAGVGEPGPAGQ